MVGIAAGGAHSLALRADTTVVAWGDCGQTNIPPALSNVVDLAAGDSHSLALRADGTVVRWGRVSRRTGSPPPASVPLGLSNVVAVAAGDSCSIALRADGTLVAWGVDCFFSTLNHFPGSLTNIVAVSCAANFCAALRNYGTVVAWPQCGSGEAPVPPHLTNVMSVAVGESGVLALRRDGRVAAWATSNGDYTNIPAGLSNVVAVARSGNVNLALVGTGPPVLTSGLVNRQTLVGGPACFRATASGAWPLSYQWQFDGINIPSATDSVLALDSVHADQAEEYSVLVSNALGMVTSPPARLSLVPVLIQAQPQSQEVDLGEAVTFSVEARAGVELSYQWRRNGVPLAGATNSTLTLVSASLDQAGDYSVMVSNFWGVATSGEAQLKVIPPFVADLLVAEIIGVVRQPELVTLMRQLTGEEPVVVGGEVYTITSRNTLSGEPIEKATQFAFEQLRDLGLHVRYQDWALEDWFEPRTDTNRNVIGIQAGVGHPEEIIVIGAHLDDLPETGWVPGADDNASGAAAVLTAARLLSQYQFDRTVHFVLFTGEEQGLLGSGDYTDDALWGGSNVVGALVADMIACRSESPPFCAVYVSGLFWPTPPAHTRLASLFTSVVASYGLENRLSQPSVRRIEPFEGTSDQESFWSAGFPAVLLSDRGAARFHTTNDTLAALDFGYYEAMVQALVGTAAHLAHPIGRGVPEQPVLGPVVLLSNGSVQVTFTGLAGRTYSIQASTDLMNWLTITNVTLSSTPGQFVDSAAPHFAQRFYHLVVQ